MLNFRVLELLLQALFKLYKKSDYSNEVAIGTLDGEKILI